MELFKEEILASIGESLIVKKETLAVAESVTSGLLQFAIGSIENASKFFQGGITVYNLGQKFKHLNVEPIHAENANCVSEKVAKTMALEISSMMTSDWGLSVTGYSTPVPESDNKLFAWFAISYKGRIIHSGRLEGKGKMPREVQLNYTLTIIEKFNGTLTSKKTQSSL